MEINISGNDMQQIVQDAMRRALAESLNGYTVQAQVRSAVEDWLKTQDFPVKVAAGIAQHAEPVLDATIQAAAADAAVGLGAMVRTLMRAQMVEMVLAMRSGGRYLDDKEKSALRAEIAKELWGQ